MKEKLKLFPENLNPKKESLTVEKLKILLKEDAMNDDEAKEIICSIKKLVAIIIAIQEQEESKQTNQTDNDLELAA